MINKYFAKHYTVGQARGIVLIQTPIKKQDGFFFTKMEGSEPWTSPGIPDQVSFSFNGKYITLLAHPKGEQINSIMVRSFTVYTVAAK